MPQQRRPPHRRRRQRFQQPNDRRTTSPVRGTVDEQDTLGNQAIQERVRQQQRPQQGDAATEQSSERGPTKAYTTGRRSAGASVQTVPLAQDGSWDQGDFLPHHADRANSWAANNIRDENNQDLNAWDFTFKNLDENGNEVAGARGVELILPWDAKVIDIQKTFEGSGNYGKYIAVEDVTSGLRFEVHHLDTVGDFQKGQELAGGTVIGTQGGSGNVRSQYAVHVDIVGTVEAVEQFVRANQSGKFTTKTQKNGA